MDFDFSEEQRQLRDQARRLLADRCPMSAVRKVLEGEDRLDRTLWRQFGEMGFLGAALPEAYGGAGLGYLELCVIAEELGRSLAPIPMASSIYLAAEILRDAGADAQKGRWLPGLSSGELIATVAAVEGVGRDSFAAVQASVVDGRLTGVKFPVSDGLDADIAVVLARGAGRAAPSLYLVDLRGEGVERTALQTIDPSRPTARLTFAGAPVERLGDEGEGLACLERAFDRAAVLIAFEQVGGAERAMEMARDYALERMAFGRQIGSFQAIKHMLADMYVALTLARSNAYYGAWALSVGAPQLPVAAASARVSATSAFQQCAKNNIQVHGGMGFTWEFDCHLYYRRSNALALFLGPLSEWQDLLIERMQRLGDLAAAA